MCKKQVFDQQFSEKLISADFGKLVLHIVIDKAVMRQRAAASLLYQSQYAEPAFRNLQKLIFLKIVGRILAFYTQKLLSSVLNANAQKIKVDSQLDSVWTPEGDAWFMAGYKDQMVSYCVGYKNGKRQDFIKVIRPK